MHKTCPILVVAFLVGAPILAMGQDPPPPPSPSASSAAPAAAPSPSPARDPSVEKWMWGTLGLVGVVLTVAWSIIRCREDTTRAAIGLAEARSKAIQALWKSASGPGEADPAARLEAFVARLEKLAAQMLAAEDRVAVSLLRISETATRLGARLEHLENGVQELQKRAGGK